ncbi:Type I Iterative PKS [Diaporthe australafricana]|uniref:Type I Iterative PKS n=1 Tax=Diaporthe australafricana TaxID=127596 RepID=A0ABR3XYX1_9PEZI
MRDRNFPSEAQASMLLFGPQILTYDRQALDSLRRTLSDEVALGWINKTVSDLGTYWDVAVKKIQQLATIPGKKYLADLSEWLGNGLEDSAEYSDLPNTILTPLVVITQLTQYVRYLELRHKDTVNGDAGSVQEVDLHGDYVRSTEGRAPGALGFCTGLLAAQAVASSKNQTELEANGAVAIRLAMLVGAIVDAHETTLRSSGRGSSKSFAVAWRTAEQGQAMRRIVDSLYPETYLSVAYDETRATVTTSERSAAKLVHDLRSSAITVAEVGLRGYFHSTEHREHTEALIELCGDVPELQLPSASDLVLTSYTNTNVGPIRSEGGSLHAIALRAILLQQCNWYDTFATVTSNLDRGQNLGVAFGPDRFIPPSLTRRPGLQVMHFADLNDESAPQSLDSVLDPYAQPSQGHSIEKQPSGISHDDIAVVGMSIKVAGADDVHEFSEMLKTGESQHEEIGPDRMVFDTLWREGDKNPSRKWYGNFIRDIDGFDHKFFKRSPRESSTMDLQQRLFLQAAYQAVEQSGYFTQTGHVDKHVGVYLGACAGDYEHHVGCHPANAFTATGNLKSFVPGKVSHHFGWTGPSMTFDTACSASAVAIHTACRNLLSGECRAALAGGVAMMSNFLWFQNLAGASFLSPTGQCKPFDEAADGYCRAEGIACVFLKKVSDAIADGNPILGCIASTAVYQNQNCTPLFVPNSPSLSQLFRDVIVQAKIEPRDVTLVEAHGTGTPVGDPAEYESIRLALGGPIRPKPLPIGSVKGHIGHTEGASGVISLIKIITMMRENFIPPQASYSKMSHYINVTPSDMMEVSTSLRPWSDGTKIALINNYGASGSNASMIVAQSPFAGKAQSTHQSHGNSFPFWITGFDARSIKAYLSKLAPLLRKELKATTIADLSFNINRQANRTLPNGLMLTADSLADLGDKLSQGSIEAQIAPVKAERPVILCFGGQVSTSVGLNRQLYEGVQLLRRHLDHCDFVIQSLGLPSIFPGIFSREKIVDTVQLQTMLFAMQYSCAKSWIDCGVEVAAVVGHSFGEITALSVSGVLGLKDTIRLVARRAELVRDAWGSDPGVMVAVEGDESQIAELLEESNASYNGEFPAAIACYNGPRSFTLAGSSGAMEAVLQTLSSNRRFAAVKSKKLSVTNAFHSTLVEPLKERLAQVGVDLTFNDPAIAIERATQTSAPSTTLSGLNLTPTSFVPDHMRNPVFFNHAVQRLAKKYPSAVWLEAGSNSTVTVMASRALGPTATSHFQAVNITHTEKGFRGLVDATLSLWKQGVRASFWAHHAVQTGDYEPLTLPPYQFEKSRHWLDFKSPVLAIGQRMPAISATSADGAGDNEGPGIWTFAGYHEDKKGGKGLPRFRINTSSSEYLKFVSGHMIAQTAPICPATLEVDMAIEALFSLHPGWVSDKLQPTVLDMINHAPICMDPSKSVWLEFQPVEGGNGMKWNWKIFSSSTDATSTVRNTETVHVEAQLHFRSPNDISYQNEFARLERQASHTHCAAMLADVDGAADDVLKGRNVYRTFSEIVDYGELYRGVQRVVGTKSECAGLVMTKHTSGTWLDVPLSDSFSQVGGIWVNCMTDHSAADMFIATGCEVSMRSPRPAQDTEYRHPDVWHVLARHHRVSDKVYMTDVFVFDSETGILTEVMLGIQYAKVAKASMSKMLARMTTDEAWIRNKAPATVANKHEPTPAPVAMEVAATTTVDHEEKPQKKKAQTSSRPDITDDVRNLVANVSGIEAHEITLDAEMADFGIDSLMGMELAREVEIVFKCTLNPAELMEATSLRKFVVCISSALYGSAQGGTESGLDGDSSSDNAGDNDDWSEPEQGQDSGTSSPPMGNVTPGKDALGAMGIEVPAVHSGQLNLTPEMILDSFGRVKYGSDADIKSHGLDNIEQSVIAATNRLCAALVVEAFETLGCRLRTASPGEEVERIQYEPQHQRLMDFLYRFLEQDARLIDIDPFSGQLIRTSIASPRKSSETVLQELLQTFPEFVVANKLTFYAGKHLAGVLSGKTDGIRVIFGSTEGRELVQALYCEHTFNRMNYGQMRDTIRNLMDQMDPNSTAPLRILEMGAGTGGTTYVLAPFLASCGRPVEYTFTDLSASMVANARRKFGKLYPFMRFVVHDIEQAPAHDLRGQDIVIASNAIHATHNIVASAKNIREALRPEGFLMMLEMTEVVPFIDVIFGLLEGWWLFDDGRKHAIISEDQWESDLHTAGWGHVDWTDGVLPENGFQKVIIALASGSAQQRLAIEPAPALVGDSAAQQDNVGNKIDPRMAEAESYVSKYSADFTVPARLPLSSPHQIHQSHGAVVLVTGATGSLGSHLVAHLAESPDVETVVCINRTSGKPVLERQGEAFRSRGIELSAAASTKLRVFDTDTTKSLLGLGGADYEWLTQSVSHIIHNAWPMSGTRPIKAFDAQFKALRGLIDLAKDIIASNRGQDQGFRVGFQLISSIGVVGREPLHTGEPRVTEDRVPMRAVLPIGYCEAKWACERILDETLHRYPSHFRPMAVRLGQIAGSRTSGFWNPVEHFAFLIKSAQSLRAFPDFAGVLQWVPVNDVAGMLADLLSLGDSSAAAYPVYHIDNPVGQPWQEMVPVLADALDIPRDRVIPFKDWVKLVRRAPLHTDLENPAARLIEFLDTSFERMSCGGLILDTAKSQEHSQTMAALGPVAADVAHKYVKSWKRMDFLQK